ncbi:unnamed protein product [Caenorhabditis bovis]|uniref:aECM cysteine-cradle domain-containing protein n=1 Tax=Caenorhabditis bovis TaxID=2654633 RepID=A0A8S1FD26_9PELO|nr:unnamed protein product [Caenorhabditis bovis]
MRRAIIIILSVWISVEAHTSVLQNYEERLNSAFRKSGSKTIKRYKCVEEYVTYDMHGKQIDAVKGPKFTTTVAPPLSINREHEILRKPVKKVTIAINREHLNHELTTTTTTTKKPETEAPRKSLEELDDAEADRIIEEMYLNKRNKNQKQTTVEPPIPTTPKPDEIREDRRKPVIMHGVTDSEDYYSNERIDDFPRQRNRNLEIEGFDPYDDMIFYRKMRREHRRRRPMLYDDEEDLAEFRRSPPHRQRTNELSPLRSMKRLRPFTNYPVRMLPVDGSTQPMRAPPGPMPLAQPPGTLPASLAPLPGAMNAIRPAAYAPHYGAPSFRPQPPPTPTPETLKMKPLLQSSTQEMQEATLESCSKIAKLGKQFGINDVSSWARSNCSFLQMYAPTASCELIYHFIDSCKNKHFF